MAKDQRAPGVSSAGEPEDSSLAFTVRVSTRARYVRLVMSPRDGLIVVVPRGFDRRRIDEVLRHKASWIERAAARVRAWDLAADSELEALPEHVLLRTSNETWAVKYQMGPSVDRVRAQGPPGARGRCSARESSGNRLIVRGDVGDDALCQAALRRWLVRRARAVLIPRLAVLAATHGFTVQGVSVRSQRGRWGSCSRRGHISLNMKLLFLPEDLSDYVLLHELCHTRQMNHSQAFWRLLEGCDAEAKGKARRLRDAGRYVPGWLDGERPS